MTDGWWCTLCICMLQDCLQNVIAVCVKPGVSRVLPEKCPPCQGNNLKREPCEAVQALWVGPKHVQALLGYSWTFLESSNVWGSWPHRLQVGSDTLLTRPCKPVVQWNGQTSVWPRWTGRFGADLTLAFAKIGRVEFISLGWGVVLGGLL